MQHLSRQRCLSIDVEFLQWLLRCWRLSWSQQSSGTESLSSNAEGLKGLANEGYLVQCCVPNSKCSTPSGSGTCQNTGTTCSGGKYIAGYCPGPADIEVRSIIKEVANLKAYNMDSAASRLRPRHRLRRLLNAPHPTVPAFAKTLALLAAAVIM